MAVLMGAILLFLGIGFLISICRSIVAARALRRSPNNRRPAERTIYFSSVCGNGGGMSREEVRKLPSYEYKQGGMYIVLDRILCKDDDNNNDSARNMNCMNRIENGWSFNKVDCSECAVCLDGFRGGEKCRLLPVCRHTFHAKCVDSWLYKNPLCPICRTSAQQHGRGRGTVVLESAQVGRCEMGNGGRDIAIGVDVQGGIEQGCGSSFHQSEMSNLMSNPLPSPRSLPTDEFVCNLMLTELLPLPLQYRPNDDDGGVKAGDVVSLSHSQSRSNQNQSQNPCKLISTPLPTCRADDDDCTKGIGVLSPSQCQSQSQDQNRNSCDSMSIPMPACRPPDEDVVNANDISIPSRGQYQIQNVYDSTLSLLPNCIPPDDEHVTVIGVACPDENQVQR